MSLVTVLLLDTAALRPAALQEEGGNAYLRLRLPVWHRPKMAEDLFFHVILERGEPGNGLLVHGLVEGGKFFILRAFHLARGEGGTFRSSTQTPGLRTSATSDS